MPVEPVKMPPIWRSASSSAIATTSTGNEATTMKQVASIVQVKTGIRSIVIPGARCRRIVSRMVMPISSEPKTASATPITQRSIPTPGVPKLLESGTVAVQLSSPAPLLVRNPEYIESPPQR